MDGKKIVVGILAHVDSGKTTLSEALLYQSGVIKKLGRVDHKDTYLDTSEIEKSRGITIFSKQAEFEIGDKKITLMDTPGHIDFSTEMERTLRILDYAILVISATAGITGHTLTLWKLLDRYKIPTVIFVNKMDQVGVNKNNVKKNLSQKLGHQCVDFMQEGEDFLEAIALSSELAMEHYLEHDDISEEMIRVLVKKRKLMPCFYGAALKMQGTEELMCGLDKCLEKVEYKNEFAAQVYKISRDKQGNRLTHLKITGGELKVKDVIRRYIQQGTEGWSDKVNQICIYSGSTFVSVDKVCAGQVCAVMGLDKSKVGQGLGKELDMDLPQLEPVMSFQLDILGEYNMHQIFEKLKEYEEEEPSLAFSINRRTNAIQAKVMGEVQLEVLQSILKDRFNIDANYSESTIIYKETVSGVAIGIGHFEPLKHYAEVHLLIEPTKRGMGTILESVCNVEDCPKNLQNLIKTHLAEITHTGVGIGVELTDIKITLLAAAGHDKHTEGGDFREATYRALKQGLMQLNAIILEPVYEFEIEVPLECIGRVLSDVGVMEGEFDEPVMTEKVAVITGKAPVRTMSMYNRDVMSYTKGFGRCELQNGGYSELKDSVLLKETISYNIYEEGIYTPDSVFCKHGAGFNVSWDKVKDYAHLDSSMYLRDEKKSGEPILNYNTQEELWIDQEEIDEIIGRSYKNSGKKKIPYKRKHQTPIRVGSGDYSYRPIERKEQYLLVDGYNIIFAWDELKELASYNLESATGRLLEILSNYQGVKGINVIVIFDAYKVKNREENTQTYHNISVVYTKEAESADTYIEKATVRLAKEYDVVVASSDVIEQLIIMGQGARKMSAKQLLEEVSFVERDIKENYLDIQKEEKLHTLGEILQQDVNKIKE